MRRRTSEQLMALEAESLSDWQLIRMSLVCGGINAVPLPDDTGSIQRLLVLLKNLGSKDASVFEKVIFVFICSIPYTCFFVSVLMLEITGAPWWSRYIAMGVFVLASLFLAYIGRMAVLRAGGDVLVVEGYKRRLAEKAAERRKHYRPISAQK